MKTKPLNRSDEYGLVKILTAIVTTNPTTKDHHETYRNGSEIVKIESLKMLRINAEKMPINIPERPPH